MVLMTAVAGLLGTGVGLGLILLLRGFRAAPDAAPRVRTFPRQAPSGRLWLRRVAAPAAAGMLAGMVTGWMAGAVLAALAVWTLPGALGPDREQASRIARLEAIAGWAEMLRDTLSAAAGLEQAITATAALAPDAIRGPLTAAAARLQDGHRLAAVLRELADDLADPTADLVLSGLLLAAERRASHLAEMLGSLAQAARDHAALQMSIRAARAQTRAEVRITVGATLAFAVGLVLLDRSYLHAYDTSGGQLVLLAVGFLFAAGFWTLTRIARSREPERVLQLNSAGRASRVGSAGGSS